MKNFKKFAIVLVAVVVVILIGIFFRDQWGPLVAAGIEWICDLFGIDPPQGIMDILDTAGE
jgi:hypothetical protein